MNNNEKDLSRGTIINRVIELERRIDILLSLYFCDDVFKAFDLQFSVFSTEKITLANKVSVLHWICKEYWKDVLEKHPKYFKSLTAVVEKRNELAHLHMRNNNEEYLELIRHKGYTKSIIYTSDEMLSILKLVLDTDLVTTKILVEKFPNIGE